MIVPNDPSRLISYRFLTPANRRARSKIFPRFPSIFFFFFVPPSVSLFLQFRELYLSVVLWLICEIFTRLEGNYINFSDFFVSLLSWKFYTTLFFVSFFKISSEPVWKLFFVEKRILTQNWSSCSSSWSKFTEKSILVLACNRIVEPNLTLVIRSTDEEYL